MSDMISAMAVPHEATTTSVHFTEPSNAHLEYRLRAIATNAIREARNAYGRDGGNWIDDDIRRLELIFHYLHITPTEAINVNTESYPLVSALQAGKDEFLDEAERIVRRRKSKAIRPNRIDSAAEAALSDLS